MIDDYKKIGIGLTGFGMLFLLLGVLLLFDRGLLAMGNILFLSGVTLVIGAKKTLKFFSNRKKLRGSVCFFLGVGLVLWGFTFSGFIIEGFGFLNLFGDFFPIAIAFMRRLPVIGVALNLPGVRTVIDKYLIPKRLPV
mmetsp:Transcript_35819/g.57921  ORF Transcript_35819/g.57921 Transcript_35819/m.57921 type:complete len:138 (+) Transcript_35819:54-467(+)